MSCVIRPERKFKSFCFGCNACACWLLLFGCFFSKKKNIDVRRRRQQDKNNTRKCHNLNATTKKPIHENDKRQHDDVIFSVLMFRCVCFSPRYLSHMKSIHLYIFYFCCALLFSFFSFSLCVRNELKKKRKKNENKIKFNITTYTVHNDRRRRLQCACVC